MSPINAKLWWERQHAASKEACILVVIAVCALLSLFSLQSHNTERAIEDVLLRPSKSYRIQSSTGNFTLLFSNEEIAHIGNEEFKILGRLKASEARDIKRSLLECVLIRDLGARQLDIDQQAAYGLDNAVLLTAPGQGSWTIATGVDQKGYALDQSGRLFTLDRDLAAQLRRTPEALRDNTLGIPSDCHQITSTVKNNGWKMSYLHGHWWLDNEEHAQLVDQNIFKDWLQLFKRSQAVSFSSVIPSQQYARLEFIGTSNGYQRQITLVDRGPAPISTSLRIIERQESIENTTLSECFVIDIDKTFFKYPAQAFLSKHLIPFDATEANEVQLNDLHAKRINQLWMLQPDIPANQEKITELLQALNNLPNQSNSNNISIGSIRNGSLKFQIPSNPQTQALAKSIAHYQFVDERLMPLINSELITGLVIHSQGEAPQLYQKNDNDDWDLDPEIHAEIKDFVEALSASRVRTWTSNYNPQLHWTSTLTVAFGDKRLVIQKTDEHFIGIKAYNAQGYLDAASIKDLFGE